MLFRKHKFDINCCAMLSSLVSACVLFIFIFELARDLPEILFEVFQIIFFFTQHPLLMYNIHPLTSVIFRQTLMRPLLPCASLLLHCSILIDMFLPPFVTLWSHSMLQRVSKDIGRYSEPWYTQESVLELVLSVVKCSWVQQVGIPCMHCLN